MFHLPKGLSEHNDLDQLKRQAKELLKAVESGDPLARDIVERFLPQASTTGLQLSGAQLVVARHHGYASWAKLRAHVDRVNLSRLVDHVQRGELSEVRSLLRQRPELVHMDMAENDEHRVLHYAVLTRNEPMVRLLVEAGADAHKGIYPHREATTAYVIARERGYDSIVSAIEEEEQFRRRNLSCPNAAVSPAQDELNKLIRAGEESEAILMLEAEPSLARACDRDGGTPLHVACEVAAMDVIDWLLENHTNTRKEDIKGQTPLDRGVRRVRWKERDRRFDFPEIARRLLIHGTPMSPLVAAALGDVVALRLFHERNPQSTINAWNGEAGLLSTAILFGKNEAVRLLLDLGLDPNERTRLSNVEEEVSSWGHPLWLAAAFGEYELARILLERGADPMGNVYASGTPVDRAYGARDEQMKALLASYGGRPSPGTIGIYRETEAAARLLDGDLSEENIRELLWAGACGGDLEIVRMCLPRLSWISTDPRWHSVMVQPLRIWNHSPVGEHPECFDRSTYPECLRMILAHGVDVNLPGKFGDTLMHVVAAEGKCWGIVVMTEEERLEFARIILDAEPDLTLRDHLLKSTSLAWACRWGRLDLVRLLLDHGCPVNEPQAESWATPLAWAEKSGYPAIVSLLKERGALR